MRFANELDVDLNSGRVAGSCPPGIRTSVGQPVEWDLANQRKNLSVYRQDMNHDDTLDNLNERRL
jgi:hypothetical protein